MIVRLGERTYLHWDGPGEWFFRICGRGLAVRDHRRHPPLFTERNNGQLGIRKQRYVHVGPYCLKVLR